MTERQVKNLKGHLVCGCGVGSGPGIGLNPSSDSSWFWTIRKNSDSFCNSLQERSFFLL